MRCEQCSRMRDVQRVRIMLPRVRAPEIRYYCRICRGDPPPPMSIPRVPAQPHALNGCAACPRPCLIDGRICQRCANLIVDHIRRNPEKPPRSGTKLYRAYRLAPPAQFARWINGAAALANQAEVIQRHQMTHQ